MNIIIIGKKGDVSFSHPASRFPPWCDARPRSEGSMRIRIGCPSIIS